ncbi:MAG: thioredoxin family protein, partial [Bacilli bacterium]
MREINELSALNEAIQSGVTVLKFGADWCKDCKAIDPFMPEVAENYKDKLEIVSVDSEKAPDLVDKYQIMGIPS